jgi:hypothetical protein
MMREILLLVSLVLLSVGVCRADISANRLSDKCKEKTRVTKMVDGKLEFVAEKLDGFCEGYLLGVYAALVQQKAICPASDEPSADYLKSVFEKFLETLPRDKAESYLRRVSSASEVLESAYSRAFSCPKKK